MVLELKLWTLHASVTKTSVLSEYNELFKCIQGRCTNLPEITSVNSIRSGSDSKDFTRCRPISKETNFTIVQYSGGVN